MVPCETVNEAVRPSPITATDADLPADLRSVFGAPPKADRVEVEAAGIRWTGLAWGEALARPLLLLHGVTASSAIWWRVGPVLAATGRRVVTPDLPGHGGTRPWLGHHRFEDNARDVAAFAREIGLDRPRLQVVGHSWGAMTAAALPAVGLVPDSLVLLDPPVLSEARIGALVHDASNRGYETLDEARAAIRSANPAWPARDVEAKAQALVDLDIEAVREVLLRNGDWDGGLAALAHPAAQDVRTWIVRGEEHAGGYVAEAAVPALAARVGWDHVVTLAGAPHAPQRTHPAALLVALLRALDG